MTKVEPLLSVRGLSVRLGQLSVLLDVSFDLYAGERLGLIGESGSGKSMTALSLIGLLPEEMSAEGEVRLKGEDLFSTTERRLSQLRGSQVSMIFQEPMSSLNPLMRVGKQVAEVLRIHTKIPRSLARQRANELLEQVGFERAKEQARAFPHQLSGGQRQRVVLAMAVACGPSLVLADEPTTALDTTVQAQVLTHLLRLVAKGSALLLISHDLAVVSNMCERLLVMYRGRVVEAGSTQELLSGPRHPYTCGLVAIAAASSRDQARDGSALPTIPGVISGLAAQSEGCVFRERCDRSTTLCNTTPRLEGDGHKVACWHPVTNGGDRARSGLSDADEQQERGADQLKSSLTTGARGTKIDVPRSTPVPVLEAVDLTKVYARRGASGSRESVRALEGVSIAVQTGERLGLVGETGSGKSTLARVLLGLDEPTSGEVHYNGASIDLTNRAAMLALRRAVQIVFQDPFGSFDPRMRIGDSIAEPLRSLELAGDHRSRVEELLVAVGLSSSVARRYPHQFSGGERQRIAIARALAPSPQVLVADEAVSSLDLSVRAQVLNLLDDLVERLGLTLIFISHDLGVVRHLCNRVAVLRRGELVEVGAAEQVFSSAADPYTRSLLDAIPRIGYLPRVGGRS